MNRLRSFVIQSIISQKEVYLFIPHYSEKITI